MTLVEVLVSLAVVLILVSATMRMGQYIKTRSSIQLTRSALAVIDAALQQYYDDSSRKFPPAVYSLPEFHTALGNDKVKFSSDSGVMLPDAWPSAALFYFLDRHSNSRSIVGALSGSLITNKDATGKALVIELAAGGERRDLPRFIDPWGLSLRYTYVPAADTFPKVTSAGPDKVFGTEDDIENQ